MVHVDPGILERRPSGTHTGRLDDVLSERVVFVRLATDDFADQFTSVLGHFAHLFVSRVFDSIALRIAHAPLPQPVSRVPERVSRSARVPPAVAAETVRGTILAHHAPYFTDH